MMTTARPEWNRQQWGLILVPSGCIVVSTIAVALRFLTRRIFRAKLWWDDYLCLAALVSWVDPRCRVMIDRLTAWQLMSCAPHALLMSGMDRVREIQ
jgi:hypothetical protein